MVVHNFHVKCILALPAEADAPLVIDADAVLAVPVTLQRFESITRRGAQIVQPPRLVQQQQFPPRDPLNLRRQTPGSSSANNRSVSRQAKLRNICGIYNARRHNTQG